MSGRRRSPPAWPYALLGLVWLAGAGAMVGQSVTLWSRAEEAGPLGLLFGLSLGLTTLAQVLALFYVLGLAAKAATYLLMADDPIPSSAAETGTPIAVLYLTAGDFDPVAMDSLLRLDHRGPRLFVVHDDGTDETARARIASTIEAHPCRRAWEVAVLHRPQRLGGKAGAVNWVLDRLDPRWELLLLCDNDSIATDADVLTRSLREFADPCVAVVQFRNVGFAGDDEPPFQRRLARAIDVFDAFAAPQAAWGYLPFFGHNAVLRVRELRRLGGLTPGFFSDDLDFSARLTLAGKRIVYRRDITFAERHPADWASFRKRAGKWALGCMQVVRARGWSVLTRPGIPFAHRVGLLEFMMFYPAQVLLVSGLFLRHVVLPWLLPAWSPGPGYATAGWLVMGSVLAPTLAWSLRERRLREWPLLAWSCALVYGGSVLATLGGVAASLSRRDRPWVPTNLVAHRQAVPPSGWFEAGLGLLMVAVPWWCHDPVLRFPATYAFLAVFLFSPLTFAAYREGERERSAGPVALRPRVARIAGVGLPLAALLLPILASHAGATPFQVRGDRLLLDGSPVQVRGVHYSPWLPGTGPDGRSPYPGPSVVDADLDRIRVLGANAIEVTDAPGWLVDHAARRGLVTIYAFNISWNDTSEAASEARSAEIVAGVDSLRSHPGVAMWVLGHEVPPWVVDVLGHAAVEARLARLAARVRGRDPSRPVGHANWPPTKDLDLSSFDVACFNLYPTWPYEVAVKGYGPYLREVVKPLARGRPVLITEFGINSLEAGEVRQATVVGDCWREIDHSGIAGGVVFEWCDEWWKNFDNPIPGKGYWQRAYDPDDAKRLDDDPEEHYGIVRADRTPKPAIAAVRTMWRQEGRRARLPWLVLAPLGLLTWLAFRPARIRAGVARRAAPLTVFLITLLVAAGTATPARASSWSAADTVTGAVADGQFGWALSGLGDVVGDGRGDVGIGAHFFPVGANPAAGAVYVYPGGHVPGAPEAVRLDGGSANEHFGESLAGGADVDGDGRADLVVGAPLRTVGALSAAGAVDVFRGGALGSGAWRTLGGEAANDWFGQSVAIGDVNGDGKADIIVGAPFNDRGGSAAGAVFIYLGGAVSSVPWLVLVGEMPNDQFGWSVAYVGDFDGDGYGDIAVGARLHAVGAATAAGRVYLFRGGPAMDAVADRIWNGEAKDDWFGNAVAGPGDVSGGGRADVLVGAPFNDRAGSAAGAAYLFRGEDAIGAPPAAIYVGETANAQFGWSVSGAGDLDGDHVRDIVVGARMQPVGPLAAAGRIYAFRGGSTLSTTAWLTASGEQANDWFGNAVGEEANYFTLNSSAALAGAPYNDAGASAAGRAYVLGGAGSTVGVDPVPGAAFATVSPNPAARSVTVRWAEPEVSPGRVEVLDINGRAVREFALDRSGVAQWDLLDSGARPVRTGIYFLRRLGPAGATSPPARVVVLR